MKLYFWCFLHVFVGVGCTATFCTIQCGFLTGNWRKWVGQVLAPLELLWVNLQWAAFILLFYLIEGIYFHLASTPMLRFVATRIPSLKPQFSQLNPHYSHGFKAAMESPSTKRAYAATLAASLGVANEEVGVGSKMAHHPWSFQKNVDLTPSKTVMCLC